MKEEAIVTWRNAHWLLHESIMHGCISPQCCQTKSCDECYQL